ncbi:MAG: alpha/beta hydrolase [Gemmatimonadaceae bacterium]
MSTNTLSSQRATANTVNVGDIDMYYLDTGGNAPPVLLLHGLSANANSFGGIMSAGDPTAFRFIAPDLRGRARSGKPAVGYEMADHARDVIALLDVLGIKQVILGGHSFGGYLAIYIAANYPDRISRVLVIDAAISSHPRIAVLLKPSLDRLSAVATSPDDYLAEIRSAAYLNGLWDDTIEAYFRAELSENPDGTAQSATSSSAIAQSSYGIAIEPWLHHVQQTKQPVLLLNAVDAFGPQGTPPLFDEVVCRATAKAFPNGTYEQIPGNHITLLFADGASAIRTALERFARQATA